MGLTCEQPSDEDDSFGIRTDYGWIRLFLRQGNSSRERGFSGRNSCRKSDSDGPSRVCARAVVRPTIADLKWTLNRLANGSSFPIGNCTFTERPQSYVPKVRLDRPPGNWRGGLFHLGARCHLCWELDVTVWNTRSPLHCPEALHGLFGCSSSSALTPQPILALWLGTTGLRVS